MTVRYRVVPAVPNEHLFEVEATFPLRRGELDVWMPSWTPGSYLMREYARHVQGFSACDLAGGPLPVERVDKSTWRVRGPKGGDGVRVRYRLYAHELTVRTNHLDDSHGYLNGAATFVTSDEHRNEPCTLEIALPPAWRAFCALPAAEGVFTARDFDELADSPVELGPHQPVRFTVAGKPHELLVWGAGRGNLDTRALVRDLVALCEAETQMMGGSPLERYLFILHLTDRGRGGLEHASSCSLLLPRTGFRQRKSYEDALALCAHEYFHLWNVKRIKPRAFVPLVYRRECYTTLLWAMEGITSYYDTLMLRRAGIIDAAHYLTRLAEVITAVESAPGRKLLPLAEASRLAWIKHYRPDENTPNSAVSYYAKGEVVAALLDLELRRSTGNTRSLDDLMRLLFVRYGDGQGVPEDGVEAAAQEIAGGDLSAFFDRAVRSGEDLDYGVFGSVGLALKRRAKRSASDRGGTPPERDEPPRPWLGVELRSGERAVVATTYTGSPAALAGLYPDDEIVAVDGLRVGAGSLAERIDERSPGDTVHLTLFRRDELEELELRLGPRPQVACWLERVEKPSLSQRALFEAWLGEKL